MTDRAKTLHEGKCAACKALAEEAQDQRQADAELREANDKQRASIFGRTNAGAA